MAKQTFIYFASFINMLYIFPCSSKVFLKHLVSSLKASYSYCSNKSEFGVWDLKLVCTYVWALSWCLIWDSKTKTNYWSLHREYSFTAHTTLAWFSLTHCHVMPFSFPCARIRCKIALLPLTKCGKGMFRVGVAGDEAGSMRERKLSNSFRAPPPVGAAISRAGQKY